MVIELLVTDIHDGMWANPTTGELDIEGYYSALEKITKEFKPDRLFLGGDLSERINQEVIESEKSKLRENPQYVKLEQQVKGISSQLEATVKEKYGGDFQKFHQAINSSDANPEELKLIQIMTRGKEMLEKIPHQVESQIRYGEHNDALEKVKAVCSELYALLGNHDAVFMPEILTNAKVGLLNQQPLEDKKIIMGYNCGYDIGPGTEIDPKWAGPNCRLAPQKDDSQESLDESPIYQLHKDKDIDLIVTHNSGKHGPINAKFPTGLGTAKLAEDNGAVVYCGHIHGGQIWKCPDTGVHIIRPGPRYAAIVERDGKKVKKITLKLLPPYWS